MKIARFLIFPDIAMLKFMFRYTSLHSKIFLSLPASNWKKDWSQLIEKEEMLLGLSEMQFSFSRKALVYYSTKSIVEKVIGDRARAFSPIL